MSLFSGEHTLSACQIHSEASQYAAMSMPFDLLTSTDRTWIWMGEEVSDYGSNDHDGFVASTQQGRQEVANTKINFRPDGEYQETKTRAHPYVVVQNEESSFTRWVKQWRVERGITSSLSGMIVCPSYLRIISMGEKALPLILAQIRSEGEDPDHWFVALESITGENPVPEDAYGDTVKMARAWLFWAEENNVW